MINPEAVHPYWFVIPLVLAISLVYSATRHESWRKILPQAARLAGMIFTVLLVTTAILLVVNTLI
jgi:hypothetical protein